MMKLSHLLSYSMIILLMILFFINMKSIHPISLITSLIMYALMICLIMSIQSYNFMFSIMFFMMMISGLLIIFLYFASLISNEQNKFIFSLPLTINKFLNMMLLLLFLLNLFKYNFYYTFETNNLFIINSPLFQNIFNIFNYPFNNLTLLSMIYLLITLFSIIKICSTKSSSLRKLN
uniref:NADH dehydrogenase subunit 6 n=1 Tax=Solenopsis geminata TaxID=121131 RepID=E3VRU1_SOLGE|nr:NADH dehydrogenase subunit 6 [Solenopsis geminata]ADP01780.1 NADH dehydrogenase subunit 6 [Solenopsis geminata]